MRIRTHVNPLSYTERMNKQDFQVENTKFLDFEIGFGRGLFARIYAKNHPERNLIAIEIRKPMVEFVKDEIKAEGCKLDNLLLTHGKAEIFLEDVIEDASLNRIFLFHPDPWLKLRHNKRRVLQTEFLDLIYKKLKKTGEIFISTDVESLWLDMLKTIAENKKFTQIQNTNFWDNEYISHWHKFSKKENRNLFYGAFVKL